MRSALPVMLALATIALWGSRADAQPEDSPVLRAREAYDRGAAAYDAKDYARASTELARADELAPNPTVLELALNAALRARDAPTGMELAARVDKRAPDSSTLAARAKEARSAFANEVGQVVMACPSPIAFCKATMDGRLLSAGVPRWAAPGPHAVHFDADGIASDQTVRVEIGHSIEVTPASGSAPPAIAPVVPARATPPAREAPPPHEASGKLGAAWFWAFGAATLVVGGVAVVSAIDTQNQHDSYAASRSADDRSSGKSAQLRTNILFAATGALAIGTGVLGVFFVGWSNGPTVTTSARF